MKIHSPYPGVKKVLTGILEARSGEIAVLLDATGTASKLQSTDRAVLRKMRHADEDVRVAGRTNAKGSARKNAGNGAH